MDIPSDISAIPKDAVAIVIRSEREDEDFSRLGGELAARTGLLVIVCTPAETIEALDEAEMAAAGWVRASGDTPAS